MASVVMSHLKESINPLLKAAFMLQKKKINHSSQGCYRLVNEAQVEVLQQLLFFSWTYTNLRA